MKDLFCLQEGARADFSVSFLFFYIVIVRLVKFRTKVVRKIWSKYMDNKFILA